MTGLTDTQDQLWSELSMTMVASMGLNAARGAGAMAARSLVALVDSATDLHDLMQRVYYASVDTVETAPDTRAVNAYRDGWLDAMHCAGRMAEQEVTA